MKARRELKKMWSDPRMKETIDSLWREYYGLYNEKYKAIPEFDEFGDPVDEWLHNKISKEIEYGQAIGQDHLIEGNRSIAIGQGAVTKSFLETVLGAYATIPEDQDPLKWILTDRLLTLGNGKDKEHRSIVFEIFKSGLTKFLNAVKFGEFWHGEKDPEGGEIQFAQNRFQGYFDEAWHEFAFKEVNTITQIGHGFVVGTTIKLSGSVWVKSRADTASNAGTVGIVSEVIDADHFRYITAGLFPGEFIDGANYFLSTTTAGSIFIQTDPEVWNIGNVREFIGTGTPAGLEIEIDLGDEITEMEFDTPINEDWITAEYRDVVAGTADSHPLNLKAYAGYTIDSLSLQVDNGTLVVTIKINGFAITGLSGVTATTSIITTLATALNLVSKNDLVTVEWSTSYTGTPKKIFVELNMTR